MWYCESTALSQDPPHQSQHIPVLPLTGGSQAAHTQVSASFVASLGPLDLVHRSIKVSVGTRGKLSVRRTLRYFRQSHAWVFTLLNRRDGLAAPPREASQASYYLQVCTCKD